MTIVSVILAFVMLFNLDNGVNPNLPWIALLVGLMGDAIMSIGNAIRDLAKAYREGCYVRNKDNSQM